jgi:hypothetical protein
MMALEELFHCRICGLRQSEPPWGLNGKSPSYEFCSCCGVEFGNEDYSLESIKEFRSTWILNGSRWFREGEMPADWRIERQLIDVPEPFK